MFKLPKDIYPDSGARLPMPNRDQMSDEEKKIYDRLVVPGAPASDGLKGPLGIRMQNPKLAELDRTLAKYLRFDTQLKGRTSELAILVTAREMDSRFEWAAHEPQAIKQGLEPEIVDIIKYRKRIRGLKEVDAIIIHLGREMFGTRKVTSATFARALKIFGAKQLVNLVELMAHYSATAATLRVFDNQVGTDQPVLPTP